jgi:alpha-beta hydrolase superfamily lysophospholipase
MIHLSITPTQSRINPSQLFDKMSPKPSIVIVPGSFTGPELYTTLGSLLEGQGYEVFVGTLQSASRTAPEKPATMKEDAAYFRGVAEFLASQGKDVIVLGHSYGGIVATECVKGVTKAEREVQGKTGGVVRVLYLASVLGDIGQGSLEAMGGQLGPFIRILVRIYAWCNIL